MQIEHILPPHTVTTTWYARPRVCSSLFLVFNGGGYVAHVSQILELALEQYEQWLRHEGDTFQSTLKDKIVRELMTLGENV